MSKNPNFKSNDDGDEEDDDVVDDDGDDETLRRGCCVKRLTRHMARVPFEGWRGGLWLSLWCDSYRRKFRSQTSDNMERWKAEQGRGTEKKKIEREKIRRERVRGQPLQMREKVGKSRNTVFFQWFVAPEGRKVGSLKRRVRSQLATGAMQNCTPLWREAHFQVKMYKTDHFWKLRCRKSARRCGAKHISKSKCTKHLSSGPLLEVAMLKKCTPLWREAHFQVKMYKTLGFGPLLEVAMSKKCTPLWREAHFPVKMYKTYHSRTTLGGSDVEKVSKKCTPLSREAHFEVKKCKKLRVFFWAFFDVTMSKK